MFHNTYKKSHLISCAHFHQELAKEEKHGNGRCLIYNQTSKNVSYSQTRIGSQQQNNAGGCKNSGQSINTVMVVRHYLYHVYLQLSYKLFFRLRELLWNHSSRRKYDFLNPVKWAHFNKKYERALKDEFLFWNFTSKFALHHLKVCRF